MSLEIPEFLEPLLEAKSHMHAYKGPSGWRVRMRYGVDEPVNSLLDLAYLASSGKHGRNFINPHWAGFIAKHLGESASKEAT